mgnify:CR=1 FL=1
MKITDVTLTLFAWDDIPATGYGQHTGQFQGSSELGLLRIAPDEGIEDLSLEFSIRVGCSGVVDRVEATRSGGASQSYVDCVADVLGYADFPGHDMPDGMEFQYPVTVEF